MAGGARVWATARIGDGPDAVECDLSGRVDERTGLGHVSLSPTA